MKRSCLRILFALLGLSIAATTANAQWTTWNWRQLRMPSGFEDSYFLDVMFLPSNPQYGWACGHGGRVVRTTDGGATWRGTVIPAGDQLESIKFVNERVGYVSGSDNFKEGKGGIFKSIDGGATWREITPFINDRGLMRRAHVWGNYFINENTGIVVGGGCDEVQQFYRTTDGGSSWSLFLGNTSASGMSHVLMYSEDGLCYASSSGRLWRSIDGGRTFDDWQSTGGQKYWQENLANKGNTFLVGLAGTDCIGGGSPVGSIHATTDGGASWIISPAVGSIFGTFLLSERVGWAVGFQNGVYRTSDGGVSFQRYTCGLPDGSNWDDVWFVNDTLGYLAGDGLYVTTRDFSPPVISSSASTVCEGDSVTLSLQRSYPVIRWSNGARTQSIRVGISGEYYAIVSDSTRCEKTSNVIRVRVNPLPKLGITTAGKYFHICFGDSITIGINTPYPQMLWNTGERTQTIVVRNAGTYRITVTDTNGCTSSDSVKVTGGTRILPEISAQRFRFCEGDTIVLSASPGYASYEWSNGARSQSITVTQSGMYSITVRDTFGCAGTSAVSNVIADPNPLEIISVGEWQVFRINGGAIPNTILCDSIIVSNITDTTINIDAANLFRNIEFSIPLAQFPMPIPPRGRVGVRICYLPSALDIQRDTVVIGDYCKRRLIVESEGIPDTLNGGLRCDIPLRGITTQIDFNGLVASPPAPNPTTTTTTLTVRTNNETNIQVQLFDGHGATLQVPVLLTPLRVTSPVQGQRTYAITIDVSHLARGVYHLLLRSDTSTTVQMLLVD